MNYVTDVRNVKKNETATGGIKKEKKKNNMGFIGWSRFNANVKSVFFVLIKNISALFRYPGVCTCNTAFKPQQLEAV
jgi:hypothetical protein